MSDCTLASFILRDGLHAAVYDWPAPARPRGVVLIVHGLGEHAGRYDALARCLSGWGYRARAYDQRGHGRSGGRPGTLSADDDLLEDLAELADDTRRRIAAPQGCPLILLGHSMGGLVCAAFVRRGLVPVDGLVLSSPALDAGLGPRRRRLVAWLYRWAPDLALGNGLDVSRLSHDPVVVRAYRADRHVHDRSSARLARFILLQAPQVLAAAPQWSVPTLLLYAGDDHLVDPRGSHDFAAAVPARVVTSHCFDGLYHEIFNERDAQPVYEALRAWLDARCAPRAA